MKECLVCKKQIPDDGKFNFCGFTCARIFKSQNAKKNIVQENTENVPKEFTEEQKQDFLKRVAEDKDSKNINLMEKVPVLGKRIGNIAILKCEVCGNTFERTIADIKKAQKKGCTNIYCSKECSFKGQAGTFIPINERQRWKLFAEKLKRKYGDRCEICGWPPKEDFVKAKDNQNKDRRYTDGHHIIEKSLGGPLFDERNVILVCPNCHRMADRKHYTPEELFQLISKRELL